MGTSANMNITNLGHSGLYLEKKKQHISRMTILCPYNARSCVKHTKRSRALSFFGETHNSSKPTTAHSYIATDYSDMTACIMSIAIFPACFECNVQCRIPSQKCTWTECNKGNILCICHQNHPVHEAMLRDLRMSPTQNQFWLCINPMRYSRHTMLAKPCLC